MLRTSFWLFLLGLRTNKKSRENRSLVIPCFIIHGGRLLWARWFVHSNIGGQPISVWLTRWHFHLQKNYLQGTITTVHRGQILVQGVYPNLCIPAIRRFTQTGPPCNLYSESNYKLFNSSSINIRYWCWNYHKYWHQTCPPIDTH